MAISDEIQILSRKCDELGGILQRNWLLQVGVSTIGILYLSDPQKAIQTVENFKIPGFFIQVGLPLAVAYLFVRFGYALALFLLTRRALMERIEAHVDHVDQAEQEILFAATMNYSLFWFVSAMGNPPEVVNMSRLRQRLGGEPHIGKFLSIISILPTAAIIILIVGVYPLNNALAVYFIYDLNKISDWPTWSRILLAAGTGGLLLTLFYWQFWSALQLVLGNRIRLVWLCWLIAAVITVGLLLWDLNPTMLRILKSLTLGVYTFLK